MSEILSRDTEPAADPAKRACRWAGPVLEVDALSATYGGPDVFSDVSFAVQPGQILRVAGRNGAGKSTLLRCLVGVHRIGSGRVLVCGVDLGQEPVEAKRHLGFSAGDMIFPYLTGREHCHLARRIHGLSWETVDSIVERFSSWACVRALDTEARRYSHGMRQQLGLLLASLHSPCLLVLDEAADGLDEDSLVAWNAFIAERANLGHCLVYVSHREQVTASWPPDHVLSLSEQTDDPTATANGGSSHDRGPRSVDSRASRDVG